MTHAAQAIHNRESQASSSSSSSSPSTGGGKNCIQSYKHHHTHPPPPYPAQDNLMNVTSLNTGNTTIPSAVNSGHQFKQTGTNSSSSSSSSSLSSSSSSNILTNNNLTNSNSSNGGSTGGNQVALSSPLLVNLLQNDGSGSHQNNVVMANQKMLPPPTSVESTGITNRIRPTKKPIARRKDSVNSPNDSPPSLESLRTEDLLGASSIVPDLGHNSGTSAFATVNVNQQPQQIGHTICNNSMQAPLHGQVQMQQKFTGRQEISYRSSQQIQIQNQLQGVRHTLNNQQVRASFQQQRQQLLLQQQQQQQINSQQQNSNSNQIISSQTQLIQQQGGPGNSQLQQTPTAPTGSQQIMQPVSTGINAAQQRLNYFGNIRQATPPPYPRQTTPQQQQQQQPTTTTTTTHIGQQNQILNVQQQLHHNQLKNININTGATTDFRYGQSQNILSRNYQGVTTGAGNGTNAWNIQSGGIPQGAQVNTAQRNIQGNTSQQHQQQTAVGVGSISQNVPRLNHANASQSEGQQQQQQQQPTGDCGPSDREERVEEPEPEYTSTGKIRQFLINPLTGLLEPMPSESSDSEPESAVDNQDDFFSFPSPSNDRSNSIFSDDDADSNFSRRNDTTTNTDQSDSETTVKSTASEGSLKHNRIKSSRESAHSPMPGEKIKLRLKLEKSEPVTPAYKVDVSFVNTPPVRKADKSVNKIFSAGIQSSGQTGDEPRVPPLHISLRGRNASVVQIRKKEKKALKEGELDSLTIKRRGKLKKMKESTDGNKLLTKKSSLGMIIGTQSALNKLPLSNSTIINSTNSNVSKINNALQNVLNKQAGNALLKQDPSPVEGPKPQTVIAKPSSSKTGDVDDIPLHSRIPSPVKPKSGIINPSGNAHQVLAKNQLETEVQNHTSEHKIGGGEKMIFLSKTFVPSS